jgi:subtilase family serine protease
LRRFCNHPCLSFLFLLGTTLLTSVAQAQLADRISQPVDRASMSPIAGSIHPQSQTATDEGLADNAKTLSGMSINFRRTAAQEASLQALLKAQQTPGSPNYHQWLTPAQFGQQFGVSAGDLAKVSAWLQQEGFTVNGVAQSANSISFSGNVAAVERAFETQIHSYNLNGETHFANATNISVPAAMAGVVSSVRGLDDFRLKPRVRFDSSKAAGSNAHFTSGQTGGHFVAPGDFAVIYDVSPLYSAGDTGKGITLAVVGQTDIVAADITDFRGAAGLSTNNPTVVTVPGSTPLTAQEGAATDDLVETDLDLEWSGGVATGASIVLVNSADVFTSLGYVITNQIGGITIPIISQSYGACEPNVSSSNLTTIEAWLAQANSQGQTVVLAAGDTGAADCDESSGNTVIQEATQGLQVDYPGSSVYVTDAGGSEFMNDGTAQNPQTGSGTYWSANGSNDVITSAKSYIPEMVWNDTTFSIQQENQGLSAGGGGVSQKWNKPTWQAGVPGIPADGKRDVPDISLNASPYHDPYLICTQTTTATSGGSYVSSCQATSFRLSDPGQSDDGSLYPVGGTSVAAPTFAGLLAIFEQKLNTPLGLGNVNPALYSLASNATTYASAFHDIKTGNNQVPCAPSSPNCPTSGNQVIGYVAGTGYDLASGLGSVDANNLATAFATATFSLGTTTTLAVSPASPTVGVNVTLTATVAPASGTTAPGGTVTFYIDGVAQPAATLASGKASVTTNFATGGAHLVYAAYSGASGFFVSTSAVTTLNVIASGVAKTTTTLTASPTTVALSGALTLTATVQSATAGTVAGTVTFTIGSTTVGTANIIPGASGVGTATLSVASATTALGFAVGANTVNANYGGDADYAASSGSTTVTITNPGITISATNVTISSSAPGNSGTSTITLTSTGGYAGNASVSATGSVNIDASFPNGSTASVALSSGGTGSTTLTLTTIAATGNLQKGAAGSKLAGHRLAAAGGTIAGCLLLLLVPGIRRKRWPAALVMLVFLSVGAGLGCGGGTGGGAPAGNYTITVTATDSSNPNITASGNFTLTIQ